MYKQINYNMYIFNLYKYKPIFIHTKTHIYTHI